MDRHRLHVDGQRRVAAVLDAADSATSLAGFQQATLAAVEEYLGFGRSAFMLTFRDPPPHGRWRAYAAAGHGQPPDMLEEYFERWANVDALTSDAARDAFERRGEASVDLLYRHLDSPRRRYVDDFLRRRRALGLMSVLLPTPGCSDGFLTFLNSEAASEYDVRLLHTVVGPLGELLAERMPRGTADALSPREAQVAEFVALGFGNRAVAGVLGVEEDTVKKHVSHAMAKLAAASRSELAVTWATGRRMRPP